MEAFRNASVNLAQVVMLRDREFLHDRKVNIDLQHSHTGFESVEAGKDRSCKDSLPASNHWVAPAFARGCRLSSVENVS